MIHPDSDTKKELIDLQKHKDLCLEGNILKMFSAGNDRDFDNYLKFCKEKDRVSRQKRLDITKKVQEQNTKLTHLNDENQKMMEDLESKINEIGKTKEEFEIQNKELNDWKQKNITLTEELRQEMIKSDQARISAESAKKNAENDLDLLQKKTQNELISTIVRAALWVILGVGIVTTGVYVFTLLVGKDTQVISAAWSNIIGILLTNAFSIVGTIMGIKYASENKQ